jgi:acyl-CoA thioesterase II
MSSPLQTLLDALDAKPLGDDRFEAHSIECLRPRVFGGELLAQVLATATRTVQDRACHAIHVDFLFPGDPKIPIEYAVRRVRDGRRFVQRQVPAISTGARSCSQPCRSRRTARTRSASSTSECRRCRAPRA